MAQKVQPPSQSPIPLITSNGSHFRSDEESMAVAGTTQAELRKKKRTKCLIYIAAFAVFQTGIILIFALTVMRFKSPKFRIRSVSFTSFQVTGNSFNFQMVTEFGVKNTNFGHFKYDGNTVVFQYRGNTVGSVDVGNGRARAKSTKKFSEKLLLNSANVTDSSGLLSSDISSGKFQLTSSSKLDGKIHLMKVIKKKKSAYMSCTMDVDISSKTLQNIACK